MISETDPSRVVTRQHRSERFLATVAPFSCVVLVSHVNPDPDALSSMMGIQALIEQKLPGRSVTLTVDGIVARAENQAMVDLLQIPLVPIQKVVCGSSTALIMVDSQPRTGRRASEALTPQIVLDHHETPGELEGVLFRDIRPNLGATSTLVTGYLLEQDVAISRRLATALLYGVESETNGYPREAGPADDGALVWLFPRADKDLLARIRNPRLPLSYYETIQFALANAFVYRDVLFCFCGKVTQPDIIAEVADFFIRFDGVAWVFASGVFESQLKLSARVDHMGGRCGDLLRSVVNGIGMAGGHDKRAGGAIPLDTATTERVDKLLRTLRERLLSKLNVEEDQGRRLLESSPTIQVP